MSGLERHWHDLLDAAQEINVWIDGDEPEDLLAAIERAENVLAALRADAGLPARP